MSVSLFKAPKSSADCPSELEFDRWQQQDLASDRKATLDAHVPGCAHCQARVTERAALFAGLSDRDKKQIIDRAMDAAQAAAPSTPWWRRLWGEGPLMPALVAAAAMVIGFVSLRLVSLPEAETEFVQSKGSIGLAVYRERGGEVHRARSGEAMASGDRLRFGVDVPRAGHIMIVGVESGGSTYVGYPANGASRSAEVSAGATEALPGAIELDDSAGQEELHLIHCPDAFSLDQVTPIDSARLHARGCAWTSFEISKGGP